ncbi:MAG: carbohydrate ABC transporter permease [Sphaerochaeta sp.]|jgi:multiple sugar transport system permease protein
MLKRRPIHKVLIVIGAVIICIYSLMPIVWIISTSFKKPDVIFSDPPQWIVREPTLQNYKQVINNPSMKQYFKNTVIISFFSTLLSLLIAILAAYGFSRYRFRGKSTFMGMLFFSRVLPRVSLILPFFIILNKFRLVNTHLGLIIVYIIIGLPITIWLAKGFFDKIPIEIEESALLDGCGPLRILLRIIVPISAPAIGAIAMYAFILAWNELLLALILTLDISTQTISIGLSYYKLEFGISWGNLMASSVLMSIPAVLVFIFFQKSLVEGLTSGSVKE